MHTAFTVDGYRLGYWVREQKKKAQGRKLNKKQVQDLEHCGMVWSCYKRNDWFYWYTLAAEYYRVHGSLLVPLKYTTENGDKLGKWISVQRERRAGVKGRKSLDIGQIQALDRISMVWRL